MRFKVILTGVLVAAALAACGPDSASSGPGTGTGTNNAGAAASGRDSCLMGTWKVDVPDMARQAAGLMRTSGSEGSGTGNITLVFGDQMSITYDNAVIAITTPMGSGLSMKVTSTYTGTASSTDWQAKDGKLAGTMPTNTVTNKMVASVGGQEVAMPTIPFSGSLDMSKGALDYTCAGSSATLVGPVTWKLTKA